MTGSEAMHNLMTNYWFWGIAGCFLGAGLGIRNTVLNRGPFPAAVLGGTVSVYAGMLGAKVLHVLIFYPEMFFFNLPHALAFWHGTGTYLGFVPVAPIAGFCVAKIVRQPFWSNAGSFAPGLALGHAVARMGCLFKGCCFGTPTDLPWAVFSDRQQAMVHPAQLYSAAGEFLTFIVLQLLWKKEENRRYLYPLYGIMMSVHRFVVEFFRGDDPGPLIFPGLSVFQSVCIFIFCLSLAVILMLKWKRKGAFAAALGGMALGCVFFQHPPETESGARGHGGKPILVITRPLFTDALAGWKTMRTKEGYEIRIMSFREAPSAARIKKDIAKQAGRAPGGCRYILLIGDSGTGQDRGRDWHIPSVPHGLPNGRSFLSDGLYGDLDRDGCPDVPVGRVPVKRPAELRQWIRKIGRYRQGRTIPRALVWTGEGVHVPAIPARAAAMLKLDLIRGGAPGSARQGPDQASVFLEAVGRPVLASIVASHGSYRSVRLGVYRGRDVSLAVEDVAGLASGRPSGPMVFLGCNSGRFDLPRSFGPSLAEAFFFHPGGPVSVLGAAGNVSALTNYAVAREIAGFLGRKPRTVGDFLLSVQQAVLLGPGDRQEGLLPGTVGGSSGTVERDEVLMYNLLGDPCTRIKYP